MSDNSKKSNKFWIYLAAAVIIFLTGFLIGVKYARVVYSMVFDLVSFLTWFIPVAAVVLIAVLVIRHKIKAKKKEKALQEERRARMQAEQEEE